MNAINRENKPAHYYGDIVRILFMSAAVIMVVGLPAVKNYMTTPTLFSVIAILVLGFVAGLTNPKQIWEAAVNAGISTVGFLIFESYAVWAYERYSATDKFFLANLLLGFVFLFAIYFSVKTVRGLFLEKKDNASGQINKGAI